MVSVGDYDVVVRGEWTRTATYVGGMDYERAVASLNRAFTKAVVKAKNSDPWGDTDGGTFEVTINSIPATTPKRAYDEAVRRIETKIQRYRWCRKPVLKFYPL